MFTLHDLLQYDPQLNLVRGLWEGPVLGLCSLDQIQTKHLVFIKDKSYWGRLLNLAKDFDLAENAIVCEKKLYEEIKDQHLACGAMLTTDSVDLSMSFLSRPFHHEKFKSLNSWVDGRQMGTCQVHPSALIAQGVFLGQNVKIGRNVQIFPGCVILSNTSIEEGTVLFPQVTLYEDVKIGRNCRIHSGSVIGADGFGYNYKAGVHHKVWHVGGVQIEDDVEIGAGTTVDRGTFKDTFIGSGSKIDNQVQIGHNCLIGKGVILCGQVGVAGSAVIEDFCVLGGKAGVGPGVKIGKGSQVAGVAQVNHDWPAGSVIAGHPARPLKEWLRGLAMVRKLSLEKKHHKESRDEAQP